MMTEIDELGIKNKIVSLEERLNEVAHSLQIIDDMIMQLSRRVSNLEEDNVNGNI